MSTQLKISATIVGLFVLVAAGLLGFSAVREGDKKKPASSTTEAAGAVDQRLVRADSHVSGQGVSPP